MDLPPKIIFNNAPVKHESSQQINVRNIGKGPASFTVSFQEPFSVTPKEVLNLAPGDGCQFSISFLPEKVDQYSSEIVLQYSNGESQSMLVEGSSQNVNVRLDSTTVALPDTFISEESQAFIKIVNMSDITVSYCWKLFETTEDELRHRSRKIAQLSNEFEEESSAYRQARRDIESDNLQFTNKNFILSPITGEVWPGMEEVITVQFNPRVEAYFENIAFCEINGRESRLPVKLMGNGKGPLISFAFNDLNIGEVFINSPHDYEVSPVHCT